MTSSRDEAGFVTRLGIHGIKFDFFQEVTKRRTLCVICRNHILKGEPRMRVSQILREARKTPKGGIFWKRDWYCHPFCLVGDYVSDRDCCFCDERVDASRGGPFQFRERTDKYYRICPECQKNDTLALCASCRCMVRKADASASLQEFTKKGDSICNFCSDNTDDWDRQPISVRQKARRQRAERQDFNRLLKISEEVGAELGNF